jgi:hypothetical protein
MLKLSHIFSLFAVMAMLLLAVGCQKMEDLEPVSNELPGLRHGDDAEVDGIDTRMDSSTFRNNDGRPDDDGGDTVNDDDDEEDDDEEQTIESGGN